MLSSFAAGWLQTTPTFRRRSSLGRVMSSSAVLLLVVIGTLIIVLALLILFHHNHNATKGYRLRSLEYARTQLLHEQEILNMLIAKSQSLLALQGDPQIQAMQKPMKPKFIRSDLPIAVQPVLAEAY